MDEKKPDINIEQKDSKFIDDITKILTLQRNTPQCNSIYELKHAIDGMISATHVQKNEPIRNILTEMQSAIDEMSIKDVKLYIIGLQILINTLSNSLINV